VVERAAMLRSLCRQLYRNLDAEYSGIASRVRREIHHGQLWTPGGTDGVTECLFVATRKAGRRLQIDPHAMGARDAGGSLQPSIRLARARRLVEIEACRANLDFDRDFMTSGLGGTEERGARGHGSEANEGLGSERRDFRVHVDLQRCLMNSGRENRAARDARSNHQNYPIWGQGLPRFEGSFVADALKAQVGIKLPVPASADFHQPILDIAWRRTVLEIP